MADLYYNRYRDYDPVTGRYIQADPIGLAGGANGYIYAGANPVNRVDPDGKFWVPAIVGGVVGGGLDLIGQLARNGGRWSCVNPWQVGAAALSGAALSGFGPTGWLLGRGGKQAAEYGYSGTAGLLNYGGRFGGFRFGWGPRKGSGGAMSDILRLGMGKKKLDVPKIAIRSGARPIRDGAVAGGVGGVNILAGETDCDCQ
jgi:hypothetical protein